MKSETRKCNMTILNFYVALLLDSSSRADVRNLRPWDKDSNEALEKMQLKKGKRKTFVSNKNISTDIQCQHECH